MDRKKIISKIHTILPILINAITLISFEWYLIDSQLNLILVYFLCIPSGVLLYLLILSNSGLANKKMPRNRISLNLVFTITILFLLFSFLSAYLEFSTSVLHYYDVIAIRKILRNSQTPLFNMFLAIVLINLLIQLLKSFRE